MKMAMNGKSSFLNNKYCIGAILHGKDGDFHILSSSFPAFYYHLQ